MNDVNWWLMVLAFALGLALTALFMIRRVTGEVPVHASAGESAQEPYGSGSLRVAHGTEGPEGYTVKGNEDSMRYHTTASPSYERTIAEVWFRDEDTAVAAGFARWDGGKSQRDE